MTSSPPAVLASAAVLELPAEGLLSLLRDDALRASELEAFEAVLRWGEAHREGGASLKAAVAPFLPHLRFEHVPAQELQDVVRESGVVHTPFEAMGPAAGAHSNLGWVSDCASPARDAHSRSALARQRPKAPSRSPAAAFSLQARPSTGEGSGPCGK